MVLRLKPLLQDACHLLLVLHDQDSHEKICPYLHATRGNEEVAFEVIGAGQAMALNVRRNTSTS